MKKWKLSNLPKEVELRAAELVCEPSQIWPLSPWFHICCLPQGQSWTHPRLSTGKDALWRCLRLPGPWGMEPLGLWGTRTWPIHPSHTRWSGPQQRRSGVARSPQAVRAMRVAGKDSASLRVSARNTRDRMLPGLAVTASGAALYYGGVDEGWRVMSDLGKLRAGAKEAIGRDSSLSIWKRPPLSLWKHTRIVKMESGNRYEGFLAVETDFWNMSDKPCQIFSRPGDLTWNWSLGLSSCGGACMVASS